MTLGTWRGQIEDVWVGVHVSKCGCASVCPVFFAFYSQWANWTLPGLYLGDFIVTFTV